VPKADDALGPECRLPEKSLQIKCHGDLASYKAFRRGCHVPLRQGANALDRDGDKMHQKWCTHMKNPDISVY
jgi:hypothetical protein